MIDSISTVKQGGGGGNTVTIPRSCLAHTGAREVSVRNSITIKNTYAGYQVR